MTQYTPFKFPIIKVCGITRESDVDQLAAVGGNVVGLNFVPHSPRRLSIDEARGLLERITERRLTSVAVLMNPTPVDIQDLLCELQFDYLQLHGLEAPELLTELDWSAVQRPLGIIKAVSWSGRADEIEIAARWSSYSPSIDAPGLTAFLVDAYAPMAGGGTGRVARWDLLTPRPQVFGSYPLILAGGLIPKNVAGAIANVTPEGVDTASGVESEPGVKVLALVEQFCTNAKAEFAKR